MELFPARQLKIMQSVIVARATRYIGVDSGLLIKAGTWNILQHSRTFQNIKTYKHRHARRAYVYKLINILINLSKVPVYIF